MKPRYAPPPPGPRPKPCCIKCKSPLGCANADCVCHGGPHERAKQDPNAKPPFMQIGLASGVHHAILVNRRPRVGTWQARRSPVWLTLCEQKVSVISANEFDGDDPRACPACIEQLNVIEYTGKRPFPNFVY